MTTNGITLSRQLARLKDHGLTHINISLDTLDTHKFTLIARRKGEREVQTQRQRGTETQRQRQRQRHRDTETQRQRGTEAQRQRGTEGYRERDRDT
jgi:RecB family exonuclease